MLKSAALFLLAFSFLFNQPFNTARADREENQNQQKNRNKQDEALRLKADLIEVRAVVTDKQGKLIDGLKKEDFELLDKGKPQEISFFSVERVTVKSDRHSFDPNRISRPVGAVGTPDSIGRTIVLFVDTLHLSVSSLGPVKQGLKKFVDEQMTGQDLVAIVTSTGALGALEQFSQDRQVLRYAIDKLTPWRRPTESWFTPYLAAAVSNSGAGFGVGAGPEPEALTVAIEVMKAEDSTFGLLRRDEQQREAVRKANEVLAETSYQRKAMLSTLQAVTERMAEMPGQRLLVFMSDGFSMAGTGGSTDTGEVRSAINRAARSGVVIYSLDAKGLNPPAFSNASSRGLAVGGAMGGRIMSYSNASEKDLQNGMHALAKDTGGDTLFNNNDLGIGIEKALDDNRVYYALAYYPPEFKNDRQFHPITVRVKNHPEYEVRAQRGYLPIDFKKEEEKNIAKSPEEKMVKALSSPLPLTGIGVTASVDYLEVGRDNAQASIQVHIDGKNLNYQKQGSRYLLEVEVTAAIYERSGKHVHTYSETVRGNLPPERMEMGKHTGYRYSKRIPLKPGLYQARVAVREPGTDLIGTAIAWVDIPDLSNGNMTLSDILLSEFFGKERQGLDTNGDEKSAASKQERGIKFYKQESALIYYLQIYNADSKKHKEEDLLIRSEIFQSDEAIYRGGWQPVASRAMGKDSKGLEIGGQLKLTLGPGIYELRLAVKDSKSDQPVERSILFGIEPL